MDFLEYGPEVNQIGGTGLSFIFGTQRSGEVTGNGWVPVGTQHHERKGGFTGVLVVFTS